MHTLQPIPPTSTELGNLISHGKQRGYVTADEVQHAVPAAEEAAEALDAILDNLNKNGIRIIDEESDAIVVIDEDFGNDHYDALLGDSVRLYLREIGRVALLTPEQERELAQRIKDGLKAQAQLDLAEKPLEEAAKGELLKQVEVGKEARKEMAAANLRLVVSIAKRYRERGLPLLDLIQEGSVGLLRAIEKFDVAKGYKFSTYATWWIKQALSRALSDQSRLVRLPVHLGETLNRIQSARRELTQKEGRDPTDKELALFLDMTEERLRELRRTAQDPISLAMPVGEEADSTLADFIPDPHALDADDAAANGMLRDQIGEALGHLTERERNVLALRYGLVDGQPHTLEEVGRHFKVTRERVRQIEVKALRKLRHPRLNKLLKDYIDPV